MGLNTFSIETAPSNFLDYEIRFRALGDGKFAISLAKASN